jgi:hypothetical protein
MDWKTLLLVFRLSEDKLLIFQLTKDILEVVNLSNKINASKKLFILIHLMNIN